jgi:hypothetical protein
MLINCRNTIAYMSKGRSYQMFLQKKSLRSSRSACLALLELSMLTHSSNGLNVGNSNSIPATGQDADEELADPRFKRNTSSPPQTNAAMDMTEPVPLSEPPGRTGASTQPAGVPDFLMSTGKSSDFLTEFY